MLGMARHDDQQRIAAILLPRRQQFFRLVFTPINARAAAHGNRPASDAFFKLPRQRFHLFRRYDVVFGIAAHLHGCRAQFRQPRRIRLCLRQTPRQRSGGRTDQAADFQITVQRFFRQPRIRQKQRHTRAPAFPHQVGPDFGFHQNAEHRAVFAQKLPYPRFFVIRKIAALRIGKQNLRGFPPRRGHLRHQQRRIGKTPPQLAYQGLGGTRFSDRNGVYPNRAGNGIRIRLAETLVPMRPICRGTSGAFVQITPYPYRRKQPQYIIKPLEHLSISCKTNAV
ncbi:Uncharacterised protein [Neisseria meningitidis]|nr:Uncharacterised protein [Neisseria meningitidis]CWP67413.1 Uncharacterised protein [Neisseria meningitidis]CWQ19081.1 Uncharacterised protein [Neisseria meningitidis]CWQ20997.1 Uncharacterised protein [Neisseria meningitidis]CWQ67753.1 Uncharacterised protein [Neisseria meningitidis]